MRPCLCTHAVLHTDDPDFCVLNGWMPATGAHQAYAIPKDGMWLLTHRLNGLIHKHLSNTKTPIALAWEGRRNIHSNDSHDDRWPLWNTRSRPWRTPWQWSATERQTGRAPSSANFGRCRTCWWWKWERSPRPGNRTSPWRQRLRPWRSSWRRRKNGEEHRNQDYASCQWLRNIARGQRGNNCWAATVRTVWKKMNNESEMDNSCSKDCSVSSKTAVIIVREVAIVWQGL